MFLRSRGRKTGPLEEDSRANDDDASAGIAQQRPNLVVVPAAEVHVRDWQSSDDWGGCAPGIGGEGATVR